MQKTLTVSTAFSLDDGSVLPSEIAKDPALRVQLDLEKAQTTEVDIEILVNASLATHFEH